MSAISPKSLVSPVSITKVSMGIETIWTRLSLSANTRLEKCGGPIATSRGIHQSDFRPLPKSM